MLSQKGLLRVTIIVSKPIMYNFKMLITPEQKVPQRSDASQNDHKSKGYPSKTSTMQKSDTGALGIRLFIRLFKIRLNSPNLDHSIAFRIHNPSVNWDWIR